MANIISHENGEIRLQKLTPVIKALFGDYYLTELSTRGHYSITCSAQPQWSDVGERLGRLVESLSLPPNDCADDTELQNHLYALVTHFGQDSNDQLDALISHIDDDANPAMDELFALAQAFNDGHGLFSVRMQTGFYCDRDLLHHHGGNASHISKVFESHGSTHDWLAQAHEICSALEHNQVSDAAEVIHLSVQRLLADIQCANQRTAVQAELLKLMQVTA